MATDLTEADYAWARRLASRLFWLDALDLKEDAQQEACIALLLAARTHDPRRGSLKTWAHPYIRGAVIALLRSYFGDRRQRPMRRAYAASQYGRTFSGAQSVERIDALDVIRTIADRFGPTCHEALLRCGEFKASSRQPKQTLHDTRVALRPLLVSVLA